MNLRKLLISYNRVYFTKSIVHTFSTNGLSLILSDIQNKIIALFIKTNFYINPHLLSFAYISTCWLLIIYTYLFIKVSRQCMQAVLPLLYYFTLYVLYMYVWMYVHTKPCHATLVICTNINTTFVPCHAIQCHCSIYYIILSM
jgi:hypothetical protein